MNKRNNLFVVSHTHWDREWYQTFQGYRKRLVYMMDELIEHMEKNEDYKYFHLDGQTVVLEDYLKIRPKNEKRLRNLIQKGRIIIGPWYVMPDEFLVSGESLIRNLKKGFEIARSYDVEPMKCGYVTDIFGHNSQFPQLLKGFNIDSAILFRGIADYEKDAFSWEAADGSQVFCIKMDGDRCYSNFYFAIRWPFDGREYENKELAERMNGLLNIAQEKAVSNNLLMMDGVDHIEIEPKLSEILTVLNENVDEIEIRQTTLEEFILAQQSSCTELETIKGELYNLGFKGVNNRLLKNVLSSMVHIKQMNNECETLLTRWAEPFDIIAGFVKPQNNKGFLDEAWRYLLQNHPHDSICGCSISRVHKDNEYRYDQVRDIAQEVIDHEFSEIISEINTSETGKDRNIVLFNSSQKDYTGIVEVELEFPVSTQGIFKIFDHDGGEISYQVIGVRKETLNGVYRFRRLPKFPAMDFYRVVFHASIPAMGYSTYAYEEYRNVLPDVGDYTFKEYYAPTRYLGTMQVGHRTWENEFLTVNIADNGTLNVINRETGKEYRDILYFEDVGDVGDGWDYRKPLIDSKVLSISSKTDIMVESDGPLVAQWKIVKYMDLPVKMNEKGTERASDTKELKIETVISMKRGSSKLEFKTNVNNNIKEHRLRVLFPSYIETDSFFTSTPFHIQQRDIQKIDWSSYNEPETGVFPNQGMVMLMDEKDCMAVYNKGLYEVEVTEDKSHTIALTLFRSFKNEVGRSEGEMSYMQRDMQFEYALDFRQGDVHKSDILLSAENWRAGIKSICTDKHMGGLPLSNSFLKVDLHGVVLSALKEGKAGMHILRLYNCYMDTTQGYISLCNTPKKAYVLNLNEEIVEEITFNGNVIPVKLNGAQILTIGVVFTLN